MSRVGFEPMILVFGRAKTFHALNRTVTVIGSLELINFKYSVMVLARLTFADDYRVRPKYVAKMRRKMEL
jgi:hypothetical protein